MDKTISQTLSSLDHMVLKYDIKDKMLETSSKVTNYVKKLMSEKQANIGLSKRKCTLRELTQVSSNSQLMNQLLDSLFIPFTVISWIEQNVNKMFNITFSNVTLRIFIDSHQHLENINDIIRNIVLIIKWLLSITDQIERIVNVDIFLSPYEKHTNGKIFGYNEINSGVSYSGSCRASKCGCSDSRVQIFRKEEVYKVLIHELLHNLGVDLAKFNFTESIKHIHMHKKSHAILVNEAYTELIALYFHSVFYSYKHNCLLTNVLDEEKSFTEKQINKVFNVSGIQSHIALSKPNNFIQYTNVIPYYIIKYLLLSHMKQFVQLFQNKEKSFELVCNTLKDIYILKIPKVIIDESDTSLKMIKNEFL